jgi:mRNA-degrading endonuclease YafQ of YafQ-DinJ toxin-antitoxin module
MVVEALVTEDFDRAFHNLQPQKQKIVKEKIGFLIRDPRHPSLGRHQLQRIKRSIWECKIDDGMRLLHEIKNDILYLWALGGHAVVDNAHLRNFAEHTSFKPWELESEVSASSIVETTKPVYEQDSLMESITETQEETPCATLNYFAYFRTAHLRILGVPENLVRNLQDALSLEDALKTPGLPEQTCVLLEELSTSPMLESVMFDSSRLLFRSTLDRLEGYFEGKIKKLMLNLLPEQQQYVEIERIPLLLLKGTAGSGKTTIGPRIAQRG